jgi:L-2-hydroxyglutarate oxidase LhgO
MLLHALEPFRGRKCPRVASSTASLRGQFLAQKGEANGVEEFELVNTAGLKALEPSLQGPSALVSPCTGIIDSHALMLSYQADIEAGGGTIRR